MKGVDGLNRGPTAMALRCSAVHDAARRRSAQRSEAGRSSAQNRNAMRRVAVGRSSAIGFRCWNGGGAGLIVTGGRWDCGAEQGTAVLCTAKRSVAPRGGAVR